MQEILFRGKRTDTGEWVYGAYVAMHHNDSRTHTHHFIIPDGSDLSYGVKVENILVPVDGETVCQYAGLPDKNGKEIFDNDIVNVPLFSPPYMRIAFIEGAFCLANKDGEYVADIHYIHHAGIECSEIIGNIFDNPELLGREVNVKR